MPRPKMHPSLELSQHTGRLDKAPMWADPAMVAHGEVGSGPGVGGSGNGGGPGRPASGGSGRLPPSPCVCGSGASGSWAGARHDLLLDPWR
jgi:hypothetical protein